MEVCFGYWRCTEPSEQAQRGGGVGRAATETGGDRQVLPEGQAQTSSNLIRPAGPERGDRAHDEIGFPRPEPNGEGADDPEAIVWRFNSLEFVGKIGENHQAFEIVIAIR